MSRWQCILVLALVCCVMMPGTVAALKNPSAVYCEAMGYQYSTITTPGGEAGQCQLPSGEKVSAWEFLQGETGQEYSYCAAQGLESRMVTDPETCRVFDLDTCMVCVLSDGKTVEVTELMELSFEEGECGDGICAMAENTGNCPGDCPSGGFDGYCDGARDGTCDPDCTAGQDADCGGSAAEAATPMETAEAAVGVWVILLAIGGVTLLFAWKRN